MLSLFSLHSFFSLILLLALQAQADTLLGKVIKVLLDGQDANLVQVKRGLAWHYKAYEREQPVIDRMAYAGSQGC